MTVIRVPRIEFSVLARAGSDTTITRAQADEVLAVSKVALDRLVLALRTNDESTLAAVAAQMPLGIMSAAALSAIPWFREAAAAERDHIIDMEREKLNRLNAEWFAAHPYNPAHMRRLLSPDTMMRRKIRRMFRHSAAAPRTN